MEAIDRRQIERMVELLQNHINTEESIKLAEILRSANIIEKLYQAAYIESIHIRLKDVKTTEELSINDKSIQTMILDPPFIFGIHGQEGTHQKSYYSSSTHGIFRNFFELQKLYHQILWEAYRVLKKKGILIFKCQDYTDGKTTITHSKVYDWATELGFYTKDIAILYLKNGKITNPNLKQRHLRKHHSYFWIFEKSN